MQFQQQQQQQVEEVVVDGKHESTNRKSRLIVSAAEQGTAEVKFVF